MAKTTNLNVRIEPDLKIQAEFILEQLGIPVSNAVQMFLKQVVIHKGLPFDVKLPSHPLDISKMTEAELNAELEKGYADYVAGRGKPAEQVFADIRKKHDS